MTLVLATILPLRVNQLLRHILLASSAHRLLPVITMIVMTGGALLRTGTLIPRLLPLLVLRGRGPLLASPPGVAKSTIGRRGNGFAPDVTLLVLTTSEGTILRLLLLTTEADLRPLLQVVTPTTHAREAVMRPGTGMYSFRWPEVHCSDRHFLHSRRSQSPPTRGNSGSYDSGYPPASGGPPAAYGGSSGYAGAGYGGNGSSSRGSTVARDYPPPPRSRDGDPGYRRN